MNTKEFQQEIIGLQRNMYNFALSLTADREDAEDLLQDTTLKVLDSQDKFTDNYNLKGWVLTVMRNIFINNYHKVVRKQTVIDAHADLYNLHVLSESPLDSPEGSYQLSEINQVVENLSDDLRVPFQLYLGGYKYHEIADRLDMPLGTIKSRIFFARKELQIQLKDFNS
ncbi:RNA polymerase sigma factor (sigma-70 family) [Parabacteroides sp. PFB2-12]|uniref:RNA polymerase sigma factor n=1 Tax=unclassified Parabacteroides TaxID=2649774 RepID=UPI0024748006|nr:MULTISPECIES: RNA polymerase sigma factor [unclassified Parabacteroides]MDH6341995.1 RNA polymerase sigma factor (sigma-70 family) [Parabacteroides sp. PM6-13]MDH6389693.1 RNA polymerase sigma factor (sigma-70 family) [Parabacteroides sp. PFB2-12]